MSFSRQELPCQSNEKGAELACYPIAAAYVWNHLQNADFAAKFDEGRAKELLRTGAVIAATSHLYVSASCEGCYAYLRLPLCS